MSKRSGKAIALHDLLDEISVDAARYFFNSRSSNSPLDFDLDLALGLPVTETENAQITAKLQMDMQMDVNATGDDVRISYPSFSNFEDLTPILSGGEL